MARQKNRRTEQEPPGIRNYIVLMLLSAAVGAGVTWAIMSQRSTPSVQRLVPFATPGTTQNQNSAPVGPDMSQVSPADAAVVRGNMAYDHQQWPDAIREYQQAIAAGRDNPDVRTDLANAFRFSGQPEKALEQYTIAQQQNPQHENSLFNQIGLFMEVMHDPNKAIPVCEEFLRRFPTSEKAPRVREQLQIAKNL